MAKIQLVCGVTNTWEDKQDASICDIYLVLQLCKRFNHRNDVAKKAHSCKQTF